jgi:hypothetical protein
VFSENCPLADERVVVFDTAGQAHAFYVGLHHRRSQCSIYLRRSVCIGSLPLTSKARLTLPDIRILNQSAGETLEQLNYIRLALKQRLKTG